MSRPEPSPLAHGAGRSVARPAAGPAREPHRALARGYLDQADAPRPARRATGFRIAILGLVAIFVFALVFPTMRLYLSQQQELETLRAQVLESGRTTDNLQADLDRWDDPAFIQAQARARLFYIMPGEIPFRVVDPESVPALTPSPEPSPTEQATLGLLGAAIPSDDSIPWYVLLKDSMAAASGADSAATGSVGAGDGDQSGVGGGQGGDGAGGAGTGVGGQGADADPDGDPGVGGGAGTVDSSPVAPSADPS